MPPFVLPAVSALIVSAATNPAVLIISENDLLRGRMAVGRLRSPNYDTREVGSRELKRMGRLALPALSEAADDPDPEVRSRCQHLFVPAEEDEFSARAVVFRADGLGRYDHHLPGWGELRTITGGGPEARVLFAQMITSRATRQILADIGKSEKLVDGRLTDRGEELRAHALALNTSPAPALPSWADVAAVLLVDAVAGGPNDMTAGPITKLLTHPSPFRRSFAAHPCRPALERVIVRWLDSRPSGAGLVGAVRVSSALGMQDAVRYAVSLGRHRDAPVATRVNAIQILARTNDHRVIDELENLLDDATRVRVNPNCDVQVRDVALAASLTLSGRDPCAFGFVVDPARAAVSPPRFDAGRHHFPSPAARADALARWDSVRKSTPPTR